MIKLIKIAVPGFLLLTSFNLSAGTYDFTPGVWQTTTEIKYEGLPAQFAAMMKVPPQTQQECMTENDLTFAADEGCKFDRKRISAK